MFLSSVLWAPETFSKLGLLRAFARILKPICFASFVGLAITTTYVKLATSNKIDWGCDPNELETCRLTSPPVQTDIPKQLHYVGTATWSFLVFLVGTIVVGILIYTVDELKDEAGARKIAAWAGLVLLVVGSTLALKGG